MRSFAISNLSVRGKLYAVLIVFFILMFFMASGLIESVPVVFFEQMSLQKTAMAAMTGSMDNNPLYSSQETMLKDGKDGKDGKDHDKDLSVSPASHDFGDVQIGTRGSVTITLTNTGDDKIRVKKIRIKSKEFSHNAKLPLSIPAFGSISFEAMFTPAHEGTATGILKITSDKRHGHDLEVILSGTGIPSPDARLDPALLHFTLGPSDPPNCCW